VSSRARAWNIPPRVEAVVRLIGEDIGHLKRACGPERSGERAAGPGSRSGPRSY
jgi:hypothetical protein